MMVGAAKSNCSRVRKASIAERIDIAEKTGDKEEQLFLARSDNVHVRIALLKNANLDKDAANVAALDKNPDVLEALSRRKDISNATETRLYNTMAEILIRKVIRAKAQRDINKLMELIRIADNSNHSIE